MACSVLSSVMFVLTVAFRESFPASLWCGLWGIAGSSSSSGGFLLLRPSFPLVIPSSWLVGSFS